jgi:hypothetical protein
MLVDDITLDLLGELRELQAASQPQQSAGRPQLPPSSPMLHILPPGLLSPHQAQQQPSQHSCAFVKAPGVLGLAAGAATGIRGGPSNLSVTSAAATCSECRFSSGGGVCSSNSMGQSSIAGSSASSSAVHGGAGCHTAYAGSHSPAWARAQSVNGGPGNATAPAAAGAAASSWLTGHPQACNSPPLAPRPLLPMRAYSAAPGPHRVSDTGAGCDPAWNDEAAVAAGAARAACSHASPAVYAGSTGVWPSTAPCSPGGSPLLHSHPLVHLRASSSALTSQQLGHSASPSMLQRAPIAAPQLLAAPNGYA